MYAHFNASHDHRSPPVQMHRFTCRCGGVVRCVMLLSMANAMLIYLSFNCVQFEDN